MPDPRIVDEMKQQAMTERPMPADMRELMESVLQGDERSKRLIKDHLDIGNIEPEEYARDWLGREASVFIQPSEAKVVPGGVESMDAAYVPPTQTTHTDPIAKEFMRTAVAEDAQIRKNLQELQQLTGVRYVPVAPHRQLLKEHMQDQMVSPNELGGVPVTPQANDYDAVEMMKQMMKASELKAKEEGQ